MSDLTIVLLTENLVPAEWARYHRDVLRAAAGDADILTVSRVPMDWGTNLLQDAPRSVANIFHQLYRAAQVATTPYLAVAEDDVLYARTHFAWRPPPGAVGYNLCRWKVYTFGAPIFGWTDRISNATLVGDRQAILTACAAREARYPEGVPDHRVGEIGRGMVARRLGVVDATRVVRFWTEPAIVHLCHPQGLDPLEHSHRKRLPPLRAVEIPHWGTAAAIRDRYLDALRASEAQS